MIKINIEKINQITKGGIRSVVKQVPILFVRIIYILMLLFKTEVFIKLLDINYNKRIRNLAQEAFFSMLDYQSIKIYLLFILCFFSIGYLFKKRGQIIFYLISDIVISIFMIADLSYYRVENAFLALKNIFYPNTFSITNRKLINFSQYDMLFIYDVIGILCILLFVLISYKLKKYINKVKINLVFDRLGEYISKAIYIPNRSIARFIVVFVLSAICISQNSINVETNEYMHCRGYFTKPAYGDARVNDTGFIGAHYIEGYYTIKDLYSSCYISESQEDTIKNWIDYNKENLPDNEYKGVLKGKNVILIQIESLENFIINKKTNNNEITPFLNKLSKKSLYFSNFYQQNNAASSIDCDFMVNTSLFPLGDHTITQIFYGQNTYSNSLPRILENEGYSTVSTHVENTSDFNWGESHKNSFGVQKIYDNKDYIMNEIVGYGLSDRSFYSQIYYKLQNQDKPYLCQMATLSSHGPFAIDKKYRMLDLPSDVDATVLGGYFESVNYADRQLEYFFNKLDQSGELDNTVLVILGDHTGVHKNYNDYVENIDYEGGWYKNFDYKIPLFIYAKGLKPQEITNAGGQVDVMPTLLYMMGVDKDKYENTSMGRNLVNTKRNATVKPNGDIFGKPKDDRERQHLMEAYDVSEIIIRKNYYKIKK